MPRPPVTGPCRAPGCPRQAQRRVLIDRRRVPLCNRCRVRFQRHGHFLPHRKWLSDAQLDEARRLHAAGKSLRQLAALFAVNRSTLFRFSQGRKRKKAVKP